MRRTTETVPCSSLLCITTPGFVPTSDKRNYRAESKISLHVGFKKEVGVTFLNWRISSTNEGFMVRLEELKESQAFGSHLTDTRSPKLIAATAFAKDVSNQCSCPQCCFLILLVLHKLFYPWIHWVSHPSSNIKFRLL